MSRESQTIEDLDHAVENATRLVLALPNAFAVARAESSTFHLSAQSYDGPRVSGFSTELDDDGHPVPVRPDPVGAHVADGVSRYDERAQQIITAVRSVCTAVAHLERLVAPLLSDHHLATTPRAQLQREAADAALEEDRLTRENTECCRSCARAEDSQGRRIREESIYRRGDVNGRLDDPAPLCKWCYRKVEQLGALPPVDWVERHHRGETVRVHEIKTSHQLPEVLR